MKIFNTMTRKKEELVPVHPGEVRIYSCGPTVYNFFHVGNARPFIIFDTLRRYLEYRGYKVTFVQNFTDIDDKMIKKANEEGVTVRELADRYIAEYYKDADALGVKRADIAPRATENIDEIIHLIEALIQNGHAYESHGDVYFATRSMKGYGKLSGYDVDELESGARVDVSEIKRDALDFALWKAQKPGEPAWPSPWGMGRPGWHVECSAMSMKYLGDTLDIHCGGVDLVFPHHENEIAQSEGATGKPFAKYWMHNGHININNQKMSKSAGNFFTVRDIAKEFDLMAVRLFMLSAHYRSPINFSRELIEQATSALRRIENAVELLGRVAGQHQTALGDGEEALLHILDGYEARFCEAMDDDLNTADALSAVFDLIREANTVYAKQGSGDGAQKVLALLQRLLEVLGLRVQAEEAVPQEILDMAAQRQQARKEKQWDVADKLRDEIQSRGYLLEDTPQGPVVKKA